MGSLANKIVAMAAVLAALVTGGSCAPKKFPPGPNITTNYNGGACGIKNVNLPPYNGFTACGNVPIFKDGKGCGSCYEVRCKEMPECSGNPITVFITDMNYEPIAPYHFDFSGKAFGSLAKPGLNDKLRHCGIMNVEFRRVRCKLGGKIMFHVEKGSNPNYLAVLVKNVADDGNIVLMELEDKASPGFKPMKQSWGAVWRFDTPKPVKGPFSIRLTSESGKKLVAPNVIPATWKPDTLYNSNIQF
ncbi:hypothetical protein SORBI_3001G306500 [Sorghum bicolor]|uniref:Expansin-like EG45 domain-containing protein n=1 Tax=Sorghum bicolor TaxID=4558 RepID=A0A1B6QM28_SORBI|nr:hypothetical protein SORBI_3001G306500 [Sorghum bicolor]